jgi:hypothetical protein
MDNDDEARKAAFSKFVKRQKERMREVLSDDGSASSRKRKEPYGSRMKELEKNKERSRERDGSHKERDEKYGRHRERDREHGSGKRRDDKDRDRDRDRKGSRRDDDKERERSHRKKEEDTEMKDTAKEMVSRLIMVKGIFYSPMDICRMGMLRAGTKRATHQRKGRFESWVSVE